jgi:FkbH-like protein
MNGRFIFSTVSTVSDLSKKMKEAKSKERLLAAKTRVSLTILANFSTQYLVQSLYTSLVFNGINPDIFEAPYDQWEFELGNPESETYKRNADVLILALSSTRLVLERDKTVTDLCARIKRVLVRYKQASRSEVLLVLPESLREGFDPTSVFHRFVATVRMQLREALGSVVHLVHIDPLIMEFGFERWHSTKFLISAKLCCHPNCFPLYGDYLSCFVQSLIKNPVKLIVVDLDNTLWQGEVGEVGWEGVGLDKEGGGYPHLMLQKYLLELKRSGVLLAICSKNSRTVVKSVFDNRPEMILSFDDFVASEINWNPKSEGIRNILTQLNLTTDGVQFLDDSRFEREEVRAQFPELIVPELQENKETWCDDLSKTGFFTVSKDAGKGETRSMLYSIESQRIEESKKHANYSEFLKSLNLELFPRKVGPENFDRVFELIHKSNQFNLTSRRLSRAELSGLASNENVFCFCYGLKDRYSDYGIISVFIAERIDSSWEINTWLMSCRAMGRGVEMAVFDHFLRHRLQANQTIVGEYRPTEKNKPVSDLLPKIGFSENNPGGTWVFVVGKDTHRKAEYIRTTQVDLV